MLWCIIFGFFWIEAWLSVANSFVIIVSAVTWYFSDRWLDDDDDLIPGEAEVMRGFKWSFLYHGGSFALGSILIPIVFCLKAVFSYIAEKLDDAADERVSVRIIFFCCRCCLNNTEYMFRFVSDNAYIHIALTSENFCKSALHSHILILKHVKKFAVVTLLADMYMFFSQLIISLLSAVLTSGLIYTFSTTQSIYSPGAAAFLLSFFIIGGFIDIFDRGATAIFLCFVLDTEVNKMNGRDGPINMPHAVKRFIQKKPVVELMPLGMIGKAFNKDGEDR